MNKTRSHLYMFSKKITHHYFKSSPTWIFFIFWSSKILINPTRGISSLSPPRCRLTSDWHHHVIMPCHASFPWSYDELAASASYCGNASSCFLPSRAETKELNLHHRCWPPSLDHLTPTLHFYKKVISILVTLPTTKPHLHFASSTARAPRYQSSTCRHHSLSLLSHSYHPSTQRHPWWQTNRLSFASQTSYRHVNSYKKCWD
jgi:hypothetical protein